MNYFLVCAFSAVCFASLGQQCDQPLSGRIRDRHSKEPVPSAKVLLVGTERLMETDSSGHFAFSGLCPGSYTLRCIPHFGCDPVDLAVAIPYSGDDELILDVETHPVDLAQVEILAYAFRRESQASFSVKPNDLSSVRGTALGEQLARVPGVTTLNTGASIVKPVINGMHSNRLVVVNSGIRQEGQQWGSEHAPEIDPNLAETIEVIQGAQGLQYGPDAIGGVIRVEPAKLRYGKPAEGWVKLGGHSNGRGGMASGLVHGSILKGKVAFRVHGTGRISGTQRAPDYWIKNTAANEYSFSGAVGYRGEKLEVDAFYTRFVTNLGIFTGSHIGNLSDLNAAFAAEQPKDSGYFTYRPENPRQYIDHHLSRVSLAYNWNKKVRTEADFGYQYNLRQEYDLHKAYNDSIAALGLPAFELNLWTNTLDVRTIVLHGKLTSRFGVSGLKQGNAYAGRFFIPNFQKWQGGAFYIGQIDHGLWLIDFGARYDVSQLKVYQYVDNELASPEHLFQGISSSVGASRLLGHHWVAKLNAGTAWRPPSINELYSDGLHHGAAAIEVGDAALRKETVYNIQAGAQYKSRLAQLDIAVFYNYFDGYINLQPVLPPQLTIVGAFPVFYYRQSDVQLSGINGQLEIPIRKWLKYTVSGNVLLATDLSADAPVYGIPSNRLTNRLRADMPLISWRCRVFLELEGQQVFRQQRVPADADYVAPPPGYFLLNAAAGITLRKQERSTPIQLVLSVSNLTNTPYRDYMNRFRYFTDDLGRNWSLKLLIPINLSTKKEQHENPTLH